MFTPLICSSHRLTEPGEMHHGTCSHTSTSAAEVALIRTTFPNVPRVVVAGPILSPHEYITGDICVGGRPTFISYSGSSFQSKWDARTRLRPDPGLLTHRRVPTNTIEEVAGRGGRKKEKKKNGREGDEC